jgi:hypothetical protein
VLAVVLGVEWLRLFANRRAAAQSGYDPDTDGTQWKIALRLRFE